MGIGFANFSSPRVLLALSPGAAKLPKSLARVMKNSTYLVSINLPRTKRTDEAALLEIPCLFLGTQFVFKNRIKGWTMRRDGCGPKRRSWTVTKQHMTIVYCIGIIQGGLMSSIK
jgi:hypothetical protein